MTTRRETTFEDLEQIGDINPLDEILVHDSSDGREKRGQVGQLPSTGSAGGNTSYHVGTTPPAEPITGNRWYNTNDGTLRIWNGTRWVVVGPYDPSGIADTIDRILGSTAWRSQLSGAALIAAIDAATGSEDWRTGATEITGQRIVQLINTALGNSDWQLGGGEGGGGITPTQARNQAGQLLATLAQFTYDAASDVLTFSPAVLNDVPASADTVGKLVITDNRDLFMTEEIEHPATANQFTSTAYTTADNARFIGVSESSPPYADHNIGDWFVSPITLRPRILVQRGSYRDWDTTTWEAVGITTFRGGAVDQAAIQARIQANGDFWVDTDDYILYQVSNFVAGNTGGAPEHKEHHLALAETVEGALANEATARLQGDEALGDRIDALLPVVVFSGMSVTIPATADGHTYVHTGASAATFTLPPASGAGEVRDGFKLTIPNRGTGTLTVDGASSDTIDGSANIELAQNRSITVQKVASSAWLIIADTKDETGGGGGSARSFGTGAGQINPLAEGNNTGRWPKTKLPSDTVYQAELDTVNTKADAANTLTRKVALLTLYVDPGSKEQQAPATRVDALVGNYRLLITPPDVLTGEDVWVRVFARGTALHGSRVKMDVRPAPQFVVPFAINRTTATNINDNDPGDKSVDVEAHFYSSDADAGLFEVRTIPIEIVRTPRVDDRQPLLPSLGNDQIWISRGRNVVPESLGTIITPSLIISNIASFDATQNRFEDSSGNAVVVPNGAIVLLTQAVYDAAVADAQFTPNANAIFLTR